MTDAIVIIVLLVIVGLASLYIYKAKKSGKRCIGCPDGCSCGTKKDASGCGSCGCCLGSDSEVQSSSESDSKEK